MNYDSNKYIYIEDIFKKNFDRFIIPVAIENLVYLTPFQAFCTP